MPNLLAMIIVGIDPGLEGGIVVLRNREEILSMSVMPQNEKGDVDYIALKDLLRDIQFSHGPSLYIIEKVSCRPGQAAQGVLKSGRNYGAVIGMLSMLGASFLEIRPQQWAKKMAPVLKLEDEPNNHYQARLKERNRAHAVELFPIHDFLATKRSKRPHLGLVDATLIAFYGEDLK